MESKNPLIAAWLYSDRRCFHLCSAQSRFSETTKGGEYISCCPGRTTAPALLQSVPRSEKLPTAHNHSNTHHRSSGFPQPNKHKHIWAERNRNIYLYIQSVQKLVEISSAIEKYSISRNKIEFKLPCS
jgi:hypothetical protein